MALEKLVFPKAKKHQSGGDQKGVLGTARGFVSSIIKRGKIDNLTI